MMNPFYEDILQQPQSLHQLAMFYASQEGQDRLNAFPRPAIPIFTGMGASFHAALAVAPLLHTHGIPALTIEAIDLLNYGLPGLAEGSTIVFASQSGASGEVVPVAEQVQNLIAVTNEEDSPLARHANGILPVKAGPNETTVACRTYINTVATLWLLARTWSGEWDGTECQQLISLSEQCAAILNQAEGIAQQWLTQLGRCDPLIFIGHGPQMATARQAAMMLGEWPKQPALSFGLGAFRHGPIEIIDQNAGVVIFAAPGVTWASSNQLAQELTTYGARVLLVENGITRTVAEPQTNTLPIHPVLIPILDVLPAQLFAEALARQNQVPPTFRYIQKVVTAI